MIEKINEFMDSVTSKNITFNRDIEMRDMDGNTRFVCKCYATISESKSISSFIDVLEPDVFIRFKSDIQVEIDKYKEELKELAIKYNVPIII